MLVPVLIACAVIVVISIVIGVGLSVLSEKFKSNIDPREEKLRAALAGSNCGGCGYAGCDAYAKAVIYDGADPGLCVAADTAEISRILGVSVEGGKKNVAYVRCHGHCAKVAANYNFDDDGLAVVDENKCQACGKCVGVCPNHLIDIVPVDAMYLVRCSSRNKGQAVRSACADGCIGCGICVKVCPVGAITVTNNLARINQKMCTHCGKCAEKCPSKIIIKRI